MTLATVAYRISTDVSFTALLQKNADEALQQAGIVLSTDEKCALQIFLAISDQIFTVGSSLFSSEPWAVEL